MGRKFNSLVVVLSVLCLNVYATKENDKNAFKKSLNKNCDGTYSFTCLKLDLVSLVDRISENDGISILPGVAIVKENKTASTNTAEIVADLARSFPDDPDARLDAFLTRKVQGFLSNHAIKLNLGATTEPDAAFEGRRKKNRGGDNMGMLLGMGALMKGTLFAAALAMLAAIAGKALIASLISLVLSAVVGLKGLTGGGGHTTYEVVAKPVYTQSSSHSTSYEDQHGGGWNGGHGRSLDNSPLPLALQPGYKVPQ